MKLNGKVALVTGGTSGIGKGVAMRFAREGAKVGIAARREEEGRQVVELIRAAGGEAIFTRTDVACAEDCARAVAATVESFGKLDIAINNAGTETYGKPLAETDEAAWDTVLDVNLKGAFLSMKYEIPELLKQGGGAIVNIASVYGLVGSAFGASPYHASKHGLIGLSKAAALEYAPRHIRINALCPGLVLTEMAERWLAETDVGAQLKALHPLGRFASVAEIEEAVLFLASDASSFITAASMPIDGGYSAG
ncbi:glucose 1-dehydrogenase [Burkholderia plantarii]|uniref:Short-chain dehydrogenase/reductase SDR n=1 Tax=Burkholderia plantarii TaxID=41899 RepID=A0A0B6RWD8_BURPL|nr:glucose 1-dehydrogenase [Burkholderia plantarii]AJK46469.1 short-chain dehydrogenase/reductase SDR [Burkholderia plantarii]ALK30588.1 short-chain dehydrogenase/reductase SDR [Burkholderia plantarii]WLE59331.1 glucose 1-dehydrogenase [Burkholderia plantarii]GLZ19723.1 short-chain dehydrogenase [Burkholderia plantarii]